MGARVEVQGSQDLPTSPDPRAQLHEKRKAGTRVRSLDGLRGVAISLVLLSHLQIGDFGAAGPVGVTVFFVLSGYLITLILTGPEQPSLRSFYARRIRRLYPALVVAVLGATALSALDGLGGGGTRAVKALAYVSNYYAWQAGNQMGNLSHTWSLAVEEQFYLLWPLVMLMTKNLKVVVGGVVLALGWRLYLVQIEPNWLRIAFGSDTNAFALLTGGAIALMPSPRLSRTAGWASLGAILLIALIPGSARSIALLSFVVVPLAAVTVLSAGTLRLLENRVLVYLGTISYGLYLWHLPILYLGSPRILVLPLAVAIAALSWRLLEEPLLRRSKSAKTGFAAVSSTSTSSEIRRGTKRVLPDV
ncbi:MAG: acyltransferase family protein [Acidimicrobiia bacterium]